MDQTAKPRHILLPQNLHESSFEFIVLLQCILEKIYSFVRGCQTFLERALLLGHRGRNTCRLTFRIKYVQKFHPGM